MGRWCRLNYFKAKLSAILKRHCYHTKPIFFFTSSPTNIHNTFAELVYLVNHPRLPKEVQSLIFLCFELLILVEYLWKASSVSTIPMHCYFGQFECFWSYIYHVCTIDYHNNRTIVRSFNSINIHMNVVAMHCYFVNFECFEAMLIVLTLITLTIIFLVIFVVLLYNIQYECCFLLNITFGMS